MPFSLLKILSSIILLFSLVLSFSDCKKPSEKYGVDYSKEKEKHKGIHLFGKLHSLNVIPFAEANYEWITIVPFADQEKYDSPSLRYRRGDDLQTAKRDSSWKSQIIITKKSGFKVQLKPHLWISNRSSSKWRSDVYPSDDANWQKWSADYRSFIMHYAQIAQETAVDLFCIGTEFTRLTSEKPDYWRDLIKEIKQVYDGEVTYAANWYKEYEQIDFWSELDYIGIQAYFPLVDHDYPSVEDITIGWQKHIPNIEAVARKYNRPILFTEMGYKSTKEAAIKPWEWMDYANKERPPSSPETQAHCYQAFFDIIWDLPWFAGVHIWQARADYVPREGYGSHDFTPQGKLTEQIIKHGFK